MSKLLVASLVALSLVAGCKHRPHPQPAAKEHTAAVAPAPPAPTPVGPTPAAGPASPDPRPVAQAPAPPAAKSRRAAVRRIPTAVTRASAQSAALVTSTPLLPNDPSTPPPGAPVNRMDKDDPWATPSTAAPRPAKPMVDENPFGGPAGRVALD